jgi:hypothetical protein
MLGIEHRSIQHGFVKGSKQLSCSCSQDSVSRRQSEPFLALLAQLRFKPFEFDFGFFERSTEEPLALPLDLKPVDVMRIIPVVGNRNDA